MFYLFTGTPGSSKTLNLIKFVNEDSAFKDRPVFYFNIKELSPTFGWTELSEEEAIDWWSLPDGSVIIFDEAYKVFPLRGPSQKVPSHVELLAEHRHRGFDIIMCTQKVKGQVDSFVRGLVNFHYHYQRVFGAEACTRYIWNECQENTQGYHEKQAAQQKFMRFDKKYYGCYKSAEVHTGKARLPFAKLALVVFGICGGIYAAYSAVGLATGFNENAQSAFGVNTGPQSGLDSGNNIVDGFTQANIRSTDLSPAAWYQARQPRLTGFPHTAPVYDELTKPNTFPRPNCILFTDRNPQECVCHSQQATRMDVPHQLCVSIVQNGWFDDTLPETREEKELASRRLQGRQERSHTQEEYNPPPATLIGEGDHLILTSH